MSWMMVHGIISLSCVGLLWRDSLLSRNIYISSLWLKYYVGEWAKKPIKTNGWNNHTQNKREGQRKAKRCTAHRNQRRWRASPFFGRKVSHPSLL